MLKLKSFIPQDKIDWSILSLNPNAIQLLEQQPDKIDWNMLSSNPNAIHLLEQNLDKINWNMLLVNLSIFEYDYISMKKSMCKLKQELVEVVLNPINYNKFKEWGY